MAKLLRALASANPAVIVIDKYYGLGCKADESKALLAAMHDVSQRIPLVILRFDRSSLTARNNEEDRLRILQQKHAVISAQTLDVDSNVKYGLKTLNLDERKIPLQWPVIPEDKFEKLSVADLAKLDPVLEPTVAVTAVTQYDPSALTQESIRWFTRRGIHPFTSFLKPWQIPTTAAIDVMCDEKHERNFDWRHCATSASQERRLKELRNRVVVIGQNDATDIHASVIGHVPGVVLQANYIESLLDDRYLKPSPVWVQLLISIAWLGLVEYWFTRYESQPTVALILSAISICVLWLVTYDIAVLQLGRYLVIWPPSVIAMVTRYASLKLQPKDRDRARVDPQVPVNAA